MDAMRPDLRLLTELRDALRALSTQRETYDARYDRRGFSPPPNVVAFYNDDFTPDDECVVDGELVPLDAGYVPESSPTLKISAPGGLAVSVGSANIGDAASATQDGVATLAIRDDALSTLADPEGDLVGLRTNSVGALHTEVGASTTGIGKARGTTAGATDVGAALMSEIYNAPVALEAEFKYMPLLSADGLLWVRRRRINWDVTLSLDTSAYAAGDVLAEVQDAGTVVAGASVQGVHLRSLTIIDKDDQGAAMDLYFFDSSSASLGTENSAPSISDAHAATIVSVVSVAAADYKDLGGSKVVHISGIDSIVSTASNGKLYVGVVTQGTPTHTASGIVLRIGLEY